MGKTEAGPAPVVYEVRLSAEPDITASFDEWLDAHVRDMIALPGFYDARVVRADPSPDGRIRRIIRYRLRNRDALDDYLARHAPVMRRDGIERFGDRFSAERDVYPALSADEETGEHRCPNCGAVANRRFCGSCGQEQKDYHVSFFRLVKDFLGDTFTFDSRLFRSLGPLIRRPGFLTREFIEGRRVRYIPPLRLYLFISIVFFALMSSLLDDLEINHDSDALVGADTEIVSEESRREAPVPAGRDDETRGGIPGTGVQFEQGLEDQAKRVAQQPELFSRAMVDNVPLMMFLLLPVYALLLRILHPLADFVYMEHLVFTLHVHAVYFLVFILWLVLDTWVQPAVDPALDLGILNPVLGIYATLYGAFAMRRTYRQNWWVTSFKYLVLGVSYWIVLVAGIVALVMATFYWF